MTIPNTTADVSYVGDGTRATYVIPFKFFANEDLVVEVLDTNGAVSDKVLNVDYTLTGAGLPTGGSITLLGGNLANLSTLFINRDPEQVQDTSLPNGGPYFGSAIEAALDLATMAIQANRKLAANALHVPLIESLADFDGTLPLAAQRANQALLFDSSGRPTVGALTPPGTVPIASLVQVVATIADLKALTVPVTAVTYFVRGYTTIADGGAGLFVWNAGDVSADNGGTIIAPNVGSGRWNRIINGPFNVKWFGAKGDGATDDSAAFVAAQAAALVASVTSAIPLHRFVYLPAGEYRIHEVAWNARTSFIGDEVGNTLLIYNGTAATGGSLFTYAGNGGATPYAGFWNLSGYGWDRTNTSKIAQSFIKYTGSEGFDWGLKFENLQFVYFYGDVIDFAAGTGVVVNLHLNRIREDGCGGVLLSLKGNAGTESRPISIRNFTIDNNMPAGLATRLTALSLWDGVSYGQGIAKIVDGAGYNMVLENARIEHNIKAKAIGSMPSFVYTDNTIVSTITTIVMRGIVGYMYQADGGAVVLANSGRTDVIWDDCGFDVPTTVFRDLSATKAIAPTYRKSGRYLSNQQQDQGPQIGLNVLEMLQQAPTTATIFRQYRKGDITFAGEQLTDGSWIGQKCITPTDGFGCPAAQNLSTVASATAGSAVVSIPTGNLRDFMGRPAITILGAGVASADLDAVVESADVVAKTITLSVACSTSINPTTIKMRAPTFAKFGIQGAIQIAHQANSTAAVLADLVTDFNALLTKLQNSKLMA